MLIKHCLISEPTLVISEIKFWPILKSQMKKVILKGQYLKILGISIFTCTKHSFKINFAFMFISFNWKIILEHKCTGFLIALLYSNNIQLGSRLRTITLSLSTWTACTHTHCRSENTAALLTSCLPSVGLLHTAWFLLTPLCTCDRWLRQN